MEMVEVKVVKRKKGIATVIEVLGRRYTLDTVTKEGDKLHQKALLLEGGGRSDASK